MSGDPSSYPSAGADPYYPPESTGYPSENARPDFDRTGTGAPTQDDLNWGMLAHLSATIATVLSAYSLNFVGPIIIWIARKQDSPYAVQQAKEALNFQLTGLVIGVPTAIVAVIMCVLFFPLILFWIPVGILWALWFFILPIVAAVQTAGGQGFRYPLSIRFFT